MQRKGFSFFNFKLPQIPPEDRGKSLTQLLKEESERWKEHMKKKKEDGSSALPAKYFYRALMLFQCPSQLYVVLYYIIPYLFEDEWARYYFGILCWFFAINGIANWLCVMLYDPSFPMSRDKPFFSLKRAWENPPDRFNPLIHESAQQNGSTVYDMLEKDGLPWQYCNKCQIHVPPRSHHCKFCRRCILKRDHHCVKVGNCIGFNNQRYFIMLTFYAIIVGCLGGCCTFIYLKNVYWVNEAESWTDLIPPVAIYRTIFGSTHLHNCFLVIHVYIEPLFGLFGIFYFTTQMSIVLEGKTMYEVAKKRPVTNTNTISRNLKSVFGDFWALNFLFPMTIIFRQRDDGIHWDGLKYDHNANKKLEGVII
ncbi:hypothetical protein ACJMK2_003295 [Sinanodonta woodiana]|uniref:Palmitoyltransferase n=1 Tax=Sinanodonta woodiana TaxID=1069815 RepID=A0ABD3XXL7_SINWO